MEESKPINIEKEFIFAADFVTPCSMELDVFMHQAKMLSDISNLDTVYIRSNPVMPCVPPLFAADLLNGTFNRIVQYSNSPVSLRLFGSDCLQAAMSEVQAITLVDNRFGDLGYRDTSCYYSPCNVLGYVKKDLFELAHILRIGLEIPFSSACQENSVFQIKDSGADYIIVNRIFSEKQMFDCAEVASKQEIPAMFRLTVPQNRAHLEHIKSFPGVQMAEEYMSLFSDAKTDGNFVVTAMKEAVRLINLCQQVAAGVVVSAQPEQIKYLRNSIGPAGVSAE